MTIPQSIDLVLAVFTAAQYNPREFAPGQLLFLSFGAPFTPRHRTLWDGGSVGLGFLRGVTEAPWRRWGRAWIIPPHASERPLSPWYNDFGFAPGQLLFYRLGVSLYRIFDTRSCSPVGRVGLGPL